jgi:hypothetical protein
VLLAPGLLVFSLGRCSCSAFVHAGLRFALGWFARGWFARAWFARAWLAFGWLFARGFGAGPLGFVV